MERINRLKKSCIKDIILYILLIVVSIPIWNTFDVSALNYNPGIVVDKSNNNINKITYMNDEDALYKVETEDITVYNYSNTTGYYSLLLKLDDKTNIDNIKVNINYDVKNLNSFEKYYKGGYKYLVLDYDNIDYGAKKYTLSIWSFEDNNEDIDYEFIISDNNNV